MYYVIGDVKCGKSYGDILRYLARQSNFDCPTVLYIGAAALNHLRYKNCFETGLVKTYKNYQFSSLNVAPFTPFTDHHAKPEKIERAFSDADIIYFEAGDVRNLLETFERFSLKDYCVEASRAGKLVGGLCGGGSSLAERVVHYEVESGTFIDDKGIGLIPNTAISCHIDRQDERALRLYRMRMVKDRYGFNVFGLGTSQALCFNEKGEAVALNPTGKIGPVILSTSGVLEALPQQDI